MWPLAAQITAVVPPGPSAGGSVSVLVTGPGGTSNGLAYTYIPAPVIAYVSPDSSPPAGGNTVLIGGTGFTNATIVTFGLIDATSFIVVSDSNIYAVVPPGPSAGDTVSVLVTGPGGTSPAGNTYTYSLPVVDFVSPPSGPGSGGNTAIVIGSGFTNATAVTFGLTPATSFVVVSDSTIYAAVPPGPSGGGTVSVFVTGPGGDISAAGPTYTYADTPAVFSVSPSTGPPSGGNTAVIGGSGFTNATTVAFGLVAATSFVVVSDNQILAVLPPGPSGGERVSVLVTGPGGASSSPAGTTYTYAAIPAIRSISPASGPAGGGNISFITGSGFTNATAVTFGLIAATRSSWSPTIQYMLLFRRVRAVVALFLSLSLGLVVVSVVLALSIPIYPLLSSALWVSPATMLLA